MPKNNEIAPTVSRRDLIKYGSIALGFMGAGAALEGHRLDTKSLEQPKIEALPADLLQYFPSVEGKPFTRVDFSTPSNAVDAYNFIPDLVLGKPALEALYSFGEKFASSGKYFTDGEGFLFSVEPLLVPEVPTVVIIAPESAPAPLGSGISKQNPGVTSYTDGRIVSLIQAFSGEDDLLQVLATQVFAGSVGIRSNTVDNEKKGSKQISQALGGAYGAAKSGKTYEEFIDLTSNRLLLSRSVFNALQLIPAALTKKK